MTPTAQAVTEELKARNWRCSGEQQVADELREIASEIPCGQRQMHLEMAAQIVEQGQFLHPDNFAMAIELDTLRSALSSKDAEIAELRAERDRAETCVMEVAKLANPDWTEARVHPADTLDTIQQETSEVVGIVLQRQHRTALEAPHG